MTETERIARLRQRSERERMKKLGTTKPKKHRKKKNRAQSELSGRRMKHVCIETEKMIPAIDSEARKHGLKIRVFYPSSGKCSTLQVGFYTETGPLLLNWWPSRGTIITRSRNRSSSNDFYKVIEKACSIKSDVEETETHEVADLPPDLEVLTDSSLMPWGKHKGAILGTIHESYWRWFLDQRWKGRWESLAIYAGKKLGPQASKTQPAVSSRSSSSDDSVTSAPVGNPDAWKCNDGECPFEAE